jgi:hypothetical protein
VLDLKIESPKELCDMEASACNTLIRPTLHSIGAKRLYAQAVHWFGRRRIIPWARLLVSSPNHCGREHLLHQPGLASLHGSSKSTSETELGAVSVDTVGGVQVLNDHDLEAGGAALAGSNDGPSEEEFPDLHKVISKRQV